MLEIHEHRSRRIYATYAYVWANCYEVLCLAELEI